MSTYRLILEFNVEADDIQFVQELAQRLREDADDLGAYSSASGVVSIDEVTADE